MSTNARQILVGDEKFSFTRSDLLIKLILLFPITTLFQNYVGFLNKALFFAVLLVLFCKGTARAQSFGYVMAVTGLWAISMLATSMEALKTNLNMAFYYIFLVYYFVFILVDPKKIWALLVKNKGYMLGVVVLYTAAVTLSIFLPSSYQQSAASGWGDEKYFVSFSGSPNRVGPASVFVLVLITFLIQNGAKKIVALMALPQLYVVLMGGSRTYFVIGLCACVVLYYVLVGSKRKFFLSLVPVGLVAVYFVMNSSMMDKFAATIQENQGLTQQEFWRRLTNSRSVFWVEQLDMFFDTPLHMQFFGNGINFTTYNYGLWAHSDFIEIMCSYGYIGLLNYLILMIYTMATLMKTRRGHFFIKCVCVFIWFFNAFINFFYCYFCAMLCYPILLLVVNHLDDGKVKKQKIAPKETPC